LIQKKKIEKFDFFRGNFPNPEVADLIRPKQQKIDTTRPGSKIFDPDPSLVSVKSSKIKKP